MDIHHLCKMANQIGGFYEAFPDTNEGYSGAAGHLRRFWDPRMRRQLLSHIDTTGGEGVSPFMLAAVAANREALEPPTQSHTV